MSRAKGTVRSGRWTVEQAEQVLGELERSGLPVTRFAAARGLGVERLYRWQRRLGRRRPRRAATSAISFAEVAVRPGGGEGLEVHLPGGLTVRLWGRSRVEDAVGILTGLAGR